MSDLHPATNTPPSVPFAFKSHQIRTVVGDDGLPWFVAKDVCAALTIPWRGDTLSSIKPEWKSMRKLRMYEQNKRVKTISEPAVYKLAFRSNKPEADEFTNWVASEVLPAIRKTGQFTASPAPAILATKEARKPLVNLVSVWVGCAPVSYRDAWKQIHSAFGVSCADEMTTEHVASALVWVQQRIDAAMAPEAKALPAAMPSWREVYLETGGPELRRNVTEIMARLRVIEDRLTNAILPADPSDIVIDSSLAQSSRRTADRLMDTMLVLIEAYESAANAAANCARVHSFIRNMTA